MIETYLDILDADPSYTLAEALGEARSDFEDAFMEFWGVNAKGPPDDLLDDDWLEARRLWGLSQQIASLGASLVQRKGIGRDRIAEPESLAAEVSRYEQALKELTEQAKKLRPDLTTYDLDSKNPRTVNEEFAPVVPLGHGRFLFFKNDLPRNSCSVAHQEKYRDKRDDRSGQHDQGCDQQLFA